MTMNSALRSDLLTWRKKTITKREGTKKIKIKNITNIHFKISDTTNIYFKLSDTTGWYTVKLVKLR